MPTVEVRVELSGEGLTGDQLSSSYGDVAGLIASNLDVVPAERVSVASVRELRRAITSVALTSNVVTGSEADAAAIQTRAKTRSGAIKAALEALDAFAVLARAGRASAGAVCCCACGVDAGARRQGLTVIGVNATVVSVAPRAEDAAPVPGWVIGAAAGGASGLILLAMGRCAPPLCSAPLPIDTPLAQTLQNWLCSVGMVDH
jgi:hypothetical protein